jgi:ABC-2 type transport system permease protein
LIKWLRGKIFVITALVTPAAWLVFVGMAMPTNFTNNYLDFITPGILVMTMLFSSFAGGSLLMFDKMLGFLNKFLVLPSSRESILFGKISFITFRGLLQAIIILVIALLLGVHLPSPVNLGLIFINLTLFGVLFSGLATTIALLIDDHDGYAAVNSMISLPLFFASTALVPYDKMPSWLKLIASVNPVSYAIDTTRSLFSGTMTYIGTVELAILGTIVILVCMYVFRKATV